MKGIYSIKINNKYYVGKDVYIHQNKRLRQHLNLLRKNKHYNRYLQNAFNKYNGNYEYEILFKDAVITNEELSEIEQFYIELLDSYANGYNLTLGGEGGLGVKISDEERENRSIRFIGELNPQSKLSNKQFFEIVDLLKIGKTNSEIADLYNLNAGYVSLIRHKKRFKTLWKSVKDYKEIKSDGQLRGIDYETFKEIVSLLEYESNAEIERLYNLSSGIVSRIRHKKLYKKYWDMYLEDSKKVQRPSKANLQIML